MEYGIILLGTLIHFILQLFTGFSQRSFKPSGDILKYSIFAFLLIGVIFTLINCNSTYDFGECGTKGFNPLTIIAIQGNILNLLIYPVSFIVLKALKTLKVSIKKNKSM